MENPPLPFTFKTLAAAHQEQLHRQRWHNFELAMDDEDLATMEEHLETLLPKLVDGRAPQADADSWNALMDRFAERGVEDAALLKVEALEEVPSGSHQAPLPFAFLADAVSALDALPVDPFVKVVLRRTLTSYFNAPAEAREQTKRELLNFFQRLP